jgi:predicted RNA methylase
MKKMKLIIALLTGLAVAGVASRALAEEAKDTTITGKMVCGKCTLHETKSCQNVIQVEKDGKTVNYYLAKNDVSDAMHEDVCHGDSKQVVAAGKVEEKDGKQNLTATKLVAAK